MAEVGPPKKWRPVQESQRIAAIDAVRGLALLGIFLVNIRFFSMPFGSYMELAPPPEEGLVGAILHYSVKIFAESKFYPLFSMLFGMGLVMQFRRARQAGKPLVRAYSLRLVTLFLFGVVHAFGLWYGDILLLYSIVGAITLFLITFLRTPRNLIAIAAAIAFFAAVAGSGMGYLFLLNPPPTATETQPALVETDTADTSDSAYAELDPMPEPSPFEQLLEGWQTGEAAGPETPLWMEAETRAFRDGPWLQALIFRSILYASIVAFMLLGWGWHVLAMFLLGAGLMFAGLFEPRNHHWHKWFVAGGLLIGLPVSAWAAIIPSLENASTHAIATSGGLVFLAGPFVSLGYLGAITLITRSGVANALIGALAAVGRMALTNYLMQTVIATGVFYWWGLGLFGTFTNAERVTFVVGVFLAQVVFSVIWMRFFRFGPMEWLWRTLTYLRPQPLLRRPD